MSLTRRQFLVTGVTAGSVGLAGCAATHPDKTRERIRVGETIGLEEAHRYLFRPTRVGEDTFDAEVDIVFEDHTQTVTEKRVPYGTVTRVQTTDEMWFSARDPRPSEPSLVATLWNDFDTNETPTIPTDP